MPTRTQRRHGQLYYCEGAPSWTVPVFTNTPPSDTAALEQLVRASFRRLRELGERHATKFAVIRPSENLWHDIDYTFVQVVPSATDTNGIRCEFAGTCGRSAAVAVVAAAQRWRWARALVAHARTRVRLTNTGDTLVFTTRSRTRESVTFDAHFPIEKFLPDLLPTRAPQTVLNGVSATLVSAGNGYVFVDAREFGIDCPAALFAAGDDLFARLEAIRRAGAVRIGAAPGIFPKIACLLPVPDGLAVRAVSVPGWHPSLALTGLVALAVGTAISDTVPARALAEVGGRPDALVVHTPGGCVRAHCASRIIDGAVFVNQVTAFDNVVRLAGRGPGGSDGSNDPVEDVTRRRKYS